MHKKDLGNWARPRAQLNYGKNLDPFCALFYFILHIFIHIFSYFFFVLWKYIFYIFFYTQSHKFYLSSRRYFYWRRNTMNQKQLSKPPKAHHEDFFNITTCFTDFDCFLGKAQPLVLQPHTIILENMSHRKFLWELIVKDR
jgi:hypothetical protein